MRSLPAALILVAAVGGIASADTVTSWDAERDAAWELQGRPHGAFPCYDPWTDIRAVEVTGDGTHVRAVLTLAALDSLECGPGVGVPETGDRAWMVWLLARSSNVELVMRDGCVVVAWQGPTVVQSRCLPSAGRQDGRLWTWEVPLSGIVPLEGGGTRSYSLAGKLYEPYARATYDLGPAGVIEDENFANRVVAL